MAIPTFDTVDLVSSTALATDGTIVFTYPHSRVGAAYAQDDEVLVIPALGNVLAQAADTFTLSYGSSTTATLTYKDATTVPAGDPITLQLPLAEYADIVALTDNSGGTASSTLAAITGTYVEATVENTVASLAAKINKLIAQVNLIKAALVEQNVL